MNGLNDFEKLLYDELSEIRRDVASLRADFATIQKDLAVHKVRSGFFGTIGGLSAIGLKEIIQLIRGGN
jgi:hypothetical protein